MCEQGETPLHLGARDGQLDVVRVLLERGATVDATASDVRVELASSHRRRHDHCVCAAVCGSDCRSDVCIVLLLFLVLACEQGATPLHLGATFGHVDIIRLLLKSGANVNTTDQQVGVGCCWGSAVTGCSGLDGRRSLTDHPLGRTQQLVTGVVYLIIVVLLVVCVCEQGRSALYWGASNGYVDTVRVLLESGANVNATDSDVRVGLSQYCALTLVDPVVGGYRVDAVT